MADAQLAELEDALVRGYFVGVRRLAYPEDVDERARLLVDLGFATHLAGRVVPTVAGLLLFGARPRDRLPAPTLKCAFFYGLHQGAQFRDRAYAGVSERTAARDLAELAERNLLELSGGRGRSTAYRLREIGGPYSCRRWHDYGVIVSRLRGGPEIVL